MAKLSLEMGDREVYWELPDEAAVYIAQELISSIGPAEGERER